MTDAQIGLAAFWLAIVALLLLRDAIEQYRIDHGRNQAHAMRHWEVPRRRR